MAKVMLEKYIHWYSQLKNNTLKGTGIPSSTPTLLVREYQDKKHEVSINDGAVTPRTRTGAFSIWKRNIKVCQKLPEKLQAQTGMGICSLR